MYNAITTLIMCGNFVLLTFGAFWFWPRLVGTLVNFFIGCCHCSAISMMMAGVMGPHGRICGYNLAPSTYLGDEKFDEDGMTYQ